ncbi:MAG: VOC family protein [Parvularculaceae bacterium]|nr:VOC family protein [Parvularculaceae bacterium]
MTNPHMPPFHLAIAVDDLAKADAFYHGLLGCPHGRRSDQWIDYDFFGHQLVAHLSPADCAAARTNVVDGHDVPARHFGVVMAPKDWRRLAEKLQKAGADFIIKPDIRFRGEPGEQGTFFVRDPAGNALEFKCFEDMAQLFAT